MKNLDTKKMGVLEMTHSDIKETEGGIAILLGIAVGMIAGYYMTKALDEATR